MAVETTTNRIDYAGDNVSTVFAYPFIVFDATHFQVYRTSVAGVAALLVQPTDYTVSGVSNPAGGNVTLATALLTGEKLGILRVVPLKQTATYPVGNKFPSATHERIVDLLTMVTQQITETFGRALKLKVASTQKDKDLDDLVALKHLRVNAAATGIEMVDAPTGTVSFPITTAQGGLGAAVDGSAARGDLLYRTAGLIFARLAKGARGALLSYNANDPVVTAAGAKGALLTPDANADLDWTAAGADGHRPEADASQARGVKWSMPTNFAQGRLSYVSGTQVKFGPYSGTKLPVKTGGTWRLRDIGSGITSGNPTTTSNYVNGTAAQTLSASTTYLVTVFDNSGTLTFDFLTALTHAVDATTGVEIKNGDDTRTVVGMIRTNSTPNFQDDDSLRGVLSWFNRRGIALEKNFTADRSTTSTTFVELNSEIRCNFLTWGDEAVFAGFSGCGTDTVAGSYSHVSVGFDGTNQERIKAQTVTYTGNGQLTFAAAGFKSGLAEGFHYATLLGAEGAGNTFAAHGAAFVANTTPTNITTLVVRVRG